MRKKMVSTVLCFALLLSMLAFTLTLRIQVARASTTWTVDDDDPADFNTIQEAIDNAVEGDTVYVRNGTYLEHVVMNKSISLIGESLLDTVIDGNASKDSPIVLQIFNITNAAVRNLTVRNTTASGEAYGIQLYQTINVTIQNVIVTNAYYGIVVNNSTQCKVLGSRVVENYNAGIIFRGNSNRNIIVGNLISNNPTGIYIEQYSQYNVFYHNNIVDNTPHQANIFPPTHTLWSNGVEGNYWSDYTPRVDTNGDGIGDTPYPYITSPLDSCPLIDRWNQTRTYSVPPDQVVVNCNYTVASFGFNDLLKQISFYITGPRGWSGFCNVTIPNGVLSPQPPSERWIVMMGSNVLSSLNQSVGESVCVSFNYTLGSSMLENRVRIRVGNLYPPTASFQFAPDPASTIEPVNFTDTSANSTTGTITWRQWSFGDGQTEYNKTFVSHKYESKDLFNVTLTVGDNNSLTDSVTLRVWVRNLPPSAGFKSLPASPSVGLEVSFDASESRDLDGSITEYRWSFGDNTAENTTSATITHKFEHARTYNVTLTVIDDDEEEGQVAQTIPVGKGGTQIDIDAPATVKVEEQITITATLLDEDSEPVAYEQITIEVYNGDLDFSRDVNTGVVGIAMTTLSLDTSGEYVIRVSYLGSSDYVASESTRAITVDPMSTSLELQSPENTTQNKEVTVAATLLDENEDPLYNATVEFHVYNGTAWELLGASQTSQSGIASFSHTPAHAGTFALKATFSGDGKHAASTSDEHNFTVAASETDYIPYLVLVAIIAFAATLLFIFLRRRER